MRNTEYTAYFREIARRHKALKHSATEMHFARLILSGDPFSGLEMGDFINNTKAKLKWPFMLLISYEHDYQDNRNDNVQKLFHGAFIILDKPAQKDNFDQQEAILDRTEEIGEQILAFMKKDFEENMATRRLDLNGTGGEKIGPVADGYFGTRFHFTFTKTANQALFHHPENWID
jgi:hypothetical protein